MLPNFDSPTQWFLLLLIALLLLFLIGCATATRVQRALDDPNNKERIYVEQLPLLAQLDTAGTFRVRMIDQCGRVQAAYEATSVSSAVSRAMTELALAEIDAVRIGRNTADELRLNRLFGHGGSCAGRELGTIEITRVT